MAKVSDKATLKKYQAIQKKLENAQKKVQKIREVADDKVATMIRTTEVSAGAFAFGLAQGLGQGDESSMYDNIGGVPTPLLGAAVLHGLGLFGIGGDLSGHLHSFGDGAMAAFVAGFGRQIGRIKANPENTGLKLTDVVKKAMKPGVQLQGEPAMLTDGNLAGQRLSDAELAALNRI